MATLIGIIVGIFGLFTIVGVNVLILIELAQFFLRTCRAQKRLRSQQAAIALIVVSVISGIFYQLFDSLRVLFGIGIILFMFVAPPTRFWILVAYDRMERGPIRNAYLTALMISSVPLVMSLLGLLVSLVRCSGRSFE